MAADVSSITYFAPIAAFLVVFLVSFAVFHKFKLLGESKWVSLFVSLVVAVLFISVASLRLYVQLITPWFGALLVSLFFMLVLMHFSGGKEAPGWLRGFFVVGARENAGRGLDCHGYSRRSKLKARHRNVQEGYI
jgi:hypothetical protein